MSYDQGDIEEADIITLVDECHRSQKGNTAESYAMTMRVKLPNAFRFGLTGTHEAGHELQALLDRADRALYRAKGEGRNRIIATDRPSALEAA